MAEAHPRRDGRTAAGPPAAVHARTYGLSPADAGHILTDRATADLFEAATAAGGDARTLGKQFISFWSMHANARQRTIAELGIDAARLGELLEDDRRRA